jgi:hypothetical protein
MPAHAHVDQVSTSRGSCVTEVGGVSCELGDLAVGDVASVSMSVTPELPGTFGNAAAAFGDQHDPDLTNNTDVASAEVYARIDIRPGNTANTLNPDSHGVIPVALLGAAAFDVSEIDGGSSAFGPGRASARTPAQIRDVNKDGVPDLLLHFEMRDAEIADDHDTACMTGQRADGRPFTGCDVIRVVP